MFSTLNDFSDRISPVLVKELRQGLRAKFFIGIFLGLQVFLSILLLSIISASGTGDSGNMLSAIIFIFVAITLLVLQPLRGVNALHSEIKDNTIDMMVLTRLDASRIVWGKWIAIVGQSALILSTIVPYLILRYFFGGMELVQELMIMFLIFCTSLGLTALTVGLSASSNVFIRGLLPVCALPALFFSIIIYTVNSRYGGGSGLDFFAMTHPESWWSVSCYLLLLLYLGYSFLSMGASLIAPAAENHAILRRLAALALISAVAAAGWFGVYEKEFHFLLVILVAAPALLVSCTESTPLVDAVRKPFRKLGPAGKWIAPFFLPTWSSGVMFSLLIFTLAGTAFGLYDRGDFFSRGEADHWIIILGSLGGMLFPTVWQAILYRGEGQRLTNYLLVLAGSLIMFVVLLSVADGTNSNTVLYAFFWHPFAYIASLQNYGTDENMSLLMLAALLLLYFLVLSLRVLFIALAAKRRTTLSHPPA